MSVIELKNDLGKINNYLSGTQALQQQDRDDNSTVNNNRNQDSNTVDNKSEGGEGANGDNDLSSL